MAALTTDPSYKGIKNRLETEGSLLTDFDGKTPPLAVALDPLDSVNKTSLSNYQGKTPQGYIDLSKGF
jgi:hypothetical protein